MITSDIDRDTWYEWLFSINMLAYDNNSLFFYSIISSIYRSKSDHTHLEV